MISELVITKINNIVLYDESEVTHKHMDYSGIRKHYELVYFLSGDGVCTYNKKTSKDEKGHIRLLPDQPTTEYYVDSIKAGKCIDIYFDCYKPLPNEMFAFDLHKNPNIENLFKKILKLWIDKKDFYYNKCMALFYNILHEMEKSVNNYLPSAQSKKLLPAINFIHENYQSVNFDYKALPKLCKMSDTHFRNLFAKNYSSTPNEYVTNLKINRACELLVTGRFKISQIAEIVGYSDVYYFSKIFKKVKGVTPTEYRSGEQDESQSRRRCDPPPKSQTKTN